jgi:hypothetical protein
MSVLVGENGILAKVEESKQKSDNASEKEKILYAIFGTIDYKNRKVIIETWDITSISKELGESNTNIEQKNEFLEIEFIKTGNRYIADKSGNVYSMIELENAIGKKYQEIIAINANGSIVFLPTGYVISGIENENSSVKNGIVIYEVSSDITITDSFWTTLDDNGYLYCQTHFNQYVWIPCTTYMDEDNEIDIPLSRRSFTTTGSTLISDSNYFGANDNHSNPTYGEKYEKSMISSANEENEIYTIDYFCKSVEKYGGFFIGRYEAGKNNNELVIAAHQEAYGGVNCEEALAISKMDKGSVVQSLQNSYAYDTMIEFLCQSNGYFISYGISEQYGNMGTGSIYKTSEYTYEGNIVDKYNNIFDVMGNLCEWTTEYGIKSDTDKFVRRGGFCDNTSFSVRTRRTYGSYAKWASYGFRVVLYIK